jgi:predicted transcriptional regulator
MDQNDIITLTADIVSAHVSANSVTPGDLPRVIQSVYDALAGLGQAEPVIEEKREPAVSIRSSVKQDAIICLECGAKMKMLKRHLATDHDLTPADYKARWGLNADYPLVAPEYAARRRDLAVQIGLGRKPGEGRKPVKVVAAPKAVTAPKAVATAKAAAKPAKVIEVAPIVAPVAEPEAAAPKPKVKRARKAAPTAE